MSEPSVYYVLPNGKSEALVIDLQMFADRLAFHLAAPVVVRRLNERREIVAEARAEQ